LRVRGRGNLASTRVLTANATKYRAEQEHLRALRERLDFALEACTRHDLQLVRTFVIADDGTYTVKEEWRDLEGLAKRASLPTI
jgi:hypothetical protein